MRWPRPRKEAAAAAVWALAGSRDSALPDLGEHAVVSCVPENARTATLLGCSRHAAGLCPVLGRLAFSRDQ
ncbi:hypothetical protein D9Q98_005254 [Chlorella vulgaris]|uniref:Uncharacterized protein n=1 Tax=Chlorella vulgaris TaxID=3077 RepID=A0A9D4YWY2_CHLVU|nr:hypothetical protein D9Q98_005254 [Chlorella vulgaris]